MVVFIMLSHTLTNQPENSCIAFADKNSILYLRVINLFLIIHTIISEIQLFNLSKDTKGLLHYNEMYR